MTPRTTGGFTRRDGFSVTEVTMILTVMSILSGAAAPAVNDYVEQAKLVRASHDVRTLSVSLARLFNDTAAEKGIEKGWGTYDLLVGAGAVPRVDGRGTEPWAAPVGAAVGLLDDQLITNGAGYAIHRRSAASGWRGAYLEQAIGSDPWGQRYAVNMKATKTGGADVVVVSAGPDGVLESLFEVDGLPTRGDDVVSLVSSGR